MPPELEKNLKKGANKLHLTGKRRRAYIWGNPVMQKYLKKERQARKKKGKR